VGLAVAGVVAAWLALVIHPQPLFAFSAQRANVVLHARAPFPPQTAPLLDDVVSASSRARRFTTRGARIHVFLCDSPALFALFNPGTRRWAG
jgi:hypothetical protein